MCEISLHYTYVLKDECYKKLKALKEYLESLKINSTLEEGQHYSSCWEFTCKAKTELSIAEEIYEYLKDNTFAVNFLYRPKNKYYLTNG